VPTPNLNELIDRLQGGSLVPYLGPGVLADVVHSDTGAPMPADSDSLILAMNGGQPMAPRLMWEFPRAAMNVELKRGRAAVNRFLTETYGDRGWSRAALHDWLAELKPAYVVDINRDTQLQESYATTPHLLVRGIARVGGTDYRFAIHQHDGSGYREVTQEQADAGLPVLFKPMGSPLPTPTYIASDADYVDYLTELMGGFAVPAFLKRYRQGRRYLFLGLRFTRDTERMVMSDIIHGAAAPAGWALIAEPTYKERRFCQRLGIEIIEAELEELLETAGAVAAA
jgi:hypothetical protein